MNNDRQVIFKSAISGYNRNDVNDYIMDSNKRFDEKERSLKEMISALEQRNESLEAKLKDAAVKLADTGKMVSLEEAEKLRSELDSKTAELENKNTETALKDTEITRLQNLVNEMQVTVDELSNKLEKTEASLAQALIQAQTPVKTEETPTDIHKSAADQVSKIIADATGRAENIIADARAQAARIKINSEGEAAYIRSYLSESADRLIHTATVDINGCADKYIADFSESVATLQNKIKELTAELDSKKSDMEKQIGKSREEMLATLDSRVSTVDSFFNNRKDIEDKSDKQL